MISRNLGLALAAVFAVLFFRGSSSSTASATDPKDESSSLCSRPSFINVTSTPLNTNIGQATYEPNQICLWTIRAPIDSYPLLRLKSLATEANFDVFTIYDGATSSSPIIASLSGDHLPSKGN